MSRTAQARYNFQSRFFAIIVTAIFTTFLIFEFIPIDRSNFTIAVLQIIIYSFAVVLESTIVVYLIVGKNPKRNLGESNV